MRELLLTANSNDTAVQAPGFRPAFTSPMNLRKDVMKLPAMLAATLLFSGLLSTPMLDTAGSAEAGLRHHRRDCCDPCCQDTCCTPCPPPPVDVTLCVVDPCTCCAQEVCVTVPACCADETPCVADCRPGAFGRTILTYRWASCDYCVDVVLTKHGRAIVRD